jgi:hypothetical protein
MFSVPPECNIGIVQVSQCAHFAQQVSHFRIHLLPNLAWVNPFREVNLGQGISSFLVAPFLT